jgi:large subunit ribosomal protein L24
MRIKKGDTVKIRTGKDRGKTGKVLRVIPERGKIVVEGLVLAVKHLKARREGESGQRVQFPSPVAVPRVMLVCPKCSKPTRVGRATLENGKHVRTCKKCAQTFA